MLLVTTVAILNAVVSGLTGESATTENPATSILRDFEDELKL